MARPRKQTYTMAQYMDNIKEGYISNDADTQRNPAWKAIINGIIVTVLTDDYIPPIILTEDDDSMLHIADGGSRTAALRRFRYMNYKISNKTEDSVIKYKERVVDEDGDVEWRDAEFDIRGKTYEKLPKELKKKFDEYQLETVIHEHCSIRDTSKYIKRYNMHSGMNAEQKALTYIPDFAKRIKKIADSEFFIDYSDFTDSQKEKGKVNRTVIESLMCMFHLCDWKTSPSMAANYLNMHSTNEEFEKLEDNLKRLQNVITDDIKCVFNSKDSFIFLSLFDHFTTLGLDDDKFADFLREFQNDYRNNRTTDDGLIFDKIDKKVSTKDRNVVTKKLNMLISIMYEFLHIEKEDLEDIDTLEFIKETVGSEVTEEDVEFCEEMLEDLILNVDNKSILLNTHNRPSLMALITYSFKNDIDIDDWFVQFFEKNTYYIFNRKENYKYMVNDLMEFVNREEVA